MLFKQIHLQGIKSGTINLAFRRWEKANVLQGTLLKTSVGQVEIVKIEVINIEDITKENVYNAGFETREQLLKSFHRNNEGLIYKIHVRYHSEDPRIQLREQTELSDNYYSRLTGKLMRMDTHSQHGHWTRKVLITIQENPHFHAIGIARLTGFEKEWLKINIRKLKNLGLTISHTVGYELSPLGKVFLKRLRESE